MSYHLAIDVGASSGRLLLASLDYNRDLKITEVHRFSNHFRKINGYDRWDIANIFNEIIKGLEKTKQMGVRQCTLGIDTWAVDYCLIDKMGKLLAQPIAYRDSRTINTMKKVFKKIPKEEIYEKTGIQFQHFNTLFQLYEEDSQLLKSTNKVLMIPDYLTYLLTGELANELTNLSTTQLFNIREQKLDTDLLDFINLDESVFSKIVKPGTVIGKLKKELHNKYNLPDCTVVAVASHDTASAIAGIPATVEDWGYISSGTWSLFGIESKEPIISEQSLVANFTNEIGAYDTYRVLKNIPGMWFIQEIARLTKKEYSYAEIADEAEKVEPFLQVVNLNDSRFINPDNMIEEIQNYCVERDLIIPQSMGEVAMCIYSNLALAYAAECKRLEELANKKISQLHIVGGGSNITILNQLTADRTNKKVITGPSEATALGNILIQLITTGYFENILEARTWLSKQIETAEYIPSKN